MKLEFNADWIDGYAKTVERAAAELATVSGTVKEGTLSAEAFGDLGRTSRTAESYATAAGALRQQLTRAAEALTDAAANLHKVADHYGHHDEDSAAEFRRIDQR
jgi:uncharacterized protein YukE